MAFTNENKQALMLMGGLGLGAATVYLLDPAHGKNRRALLGGKLVRTWHKVAAAAQISSMDLGNRLTGLVADAWSATQPEKVTDEVLLSRVRAKLGHIVAHPSRIHTQAEQGVVTLAGDVLEGEVPDLIRATGSVRGVAEVRNQLTAHKRPEDLPALPYEKLRLHRWPPSTRLLVGGAGSLLALYGARRRGLVGSVVGTLGFGMLGRAISNMEIKDLVGLDGSSITLQKTINIDAPLSDVFEFWANPENYPLVMSHVREVKKVGENRYHWKVASPGGLSVEWEGSMTRIVPNELVAWESLPGSLVANSGVARLDPNYDASTRLHIQMSYRPPGGMLGHVLAELFGADPKSALDEDLLRLKSLFERGKTRVHDRTVTREKIEYASRSQPATRDA